MLYSNEIEKNWDGIRIVNIWRHKGAIPHSIDITASLIECLLDIQQGCYSEHASRLILTSCIVRFVNGMTDQMQKGIKSIPVGIIASSLNIPLRLVDLRHDGTHQRLPTLPSLLSAAKCSLQYLLEHYWRPTHDAAENDRERLRSDLQMVRAGTSVQPRSIITFCADNHNWTALPASITPVLLATPVHVEGSSKHLSLPAAQCSALRLPMLEPESSFHYRAIMREAHKSRPHNTAAVASRLLREAWGDKGPAAVAWLLWLSFPRDLDFQPSSWLPHVLRAEVAAHLDVRRLPGNETPLGRALVLWGSTGLLPGEMGMLLGCEGTVPAPSGDWEEVEDWAACPLGYGSPHYIADEPGEDTAPVEVAVTDPFNGWFGTQ
eukprot:gnl/Dysnectes_brevis/2068_a2390_883.p1 GENE.gnl/Dysnectes_brevis/2068_a2390_883~~gnl/Dysnectes_brevis/2068_a2390_883.p1  ORF type:complete len:402 (-),score=108.87 gnl/Dysnectes_brevis/2068_a2390_883:30-1160(-)